MMWEQTLEKGMTNGRWMRGTLALLLAGAAASCGGAEAGGMGRDVDETYVRVINVEVTEVSKETFVEEIRLTASVQANRVVDVAAEESGVIREALVEKGTPVAEGQALARIDDAILTAQVEQARAQAELASQTWERRQRLWEEDRVGSEIAYLEAKYAQEQTAASLRALEERLARTTILAPFSGILDQRMIEVGSMVAPGQVVARIVDLNPLKVMAGVPERYAADVRRGARAQITFDVLPGQVFEGDIGYVGATVDTESRTFPIEIAVRNSQGIIKPQMVANVVVTRREVADAIVVPQDALVRVEQGYVVFVAESRQGGDVAAVRPVELGPARRNLVVLASGVDEGERLIVVGQKSVADGDRVSVVDVRD
jgi:membrane fusion protein (multidrug efflux system)